MAFHAIQELRRQLERGREGAEDQGRQWASTQWASTLRDRGGDVESRLSDLWSQIQDLLRDEVTPRAQRMARDARPWAREGQHYAMEAAEQLRSATRNHPLAAIGIAVAATWMISGLLRRRD